MTRFAPQARQLAGPQFLSIGAPRRGTTRLYEVLQQHQALWLPPIKELHCFDSIDVDCCPILRLHRPRQRMARHLVRRVRHYAAAAFLLPPTRIARPLTLSPKWDIRHLRKGENIEWCPPFCPGSAPRCGYWRDHAGALRDQQANHLARPLRGAVPAAPAAAARSVGRELVQGEEAPSRWAAQGGRTRCGQIDRTGQLVGAQDALRIW